MTCKRTSPPAYSAIRRRRLSWSRSRRRSDVSALPNYPVSPETAARLQLEEELVRSGQLRAYSLSDEGREITLYRLFDRDICLFSASCIMRSIQFEVIIQAEKDSQICFIPPQVFKQLMEQSAPVANFTNELMATRFSEVMWLMEQIMWKSMDKRLAAFLLEEAAIEDSSVLKITHEAIANHIGTHREVITRMLRYFQNEGMVKLTRGTVQIVNEEKLRTLDT